MCNNLLKTSIEYIRAYHKRAIVCFLLVLPWLVAAGLEAPAVTAGREIAQDTTQYYPADSVLLHFLQEELHVYPSHDNSIKLFHAGQDKFDDLFAAIEQSQHHIHLEYFNFRDDSIGNALFDLLACKVQEGVEVRVVCDAFGNWSNNQSFGKKKLKEIRSKGIELVLYKPMRFPFVTYALYRDHRKNVIIDGRIGYMGGMNVADYYISGKPKIGDWHDTHMRIEGSAVHRMQAIFLSIWNKTTKQQIGGAAYYPKPAAGDSSTTEGVQVCIVDRMPQERPADMRLALAKTISSAQHKIQIVNPYFLPPSNIKKELQNALARGVEVEIMFSEKSDIPFTPDGTLTYAYKLVEKGAQVYMYQDAFKHSKIMMVDSSFCTVGSTNLDCRSLRFDAEINAFIFDTEITNELSRRFETDKQNSIRLTKETKSQRSTWKRFVGWLANALYPFL